MSSKSARTLQLTLQAVTKDFIKRIEAAEKKTDHFRKKAEKLSKSKFDLSKIMNTVGLSLSLGVVTSQMAKLSAEMNNLAKTSRALGVSTKNLQLLQHAAELAGANVGTLNTGLQRLVRRIGEATMGKGEALPALRELNLDVKELSKLDGLGKLNAVADALNRVQDQGRKLALATKLVDVEFARQLLILIEKDSSAIKTATKDMEDFGTTITKSQLDAIERMQDRWSRFWSVVGDTGKQTLGNLAIMTEALRGVIGFGGAPQGPNKNLQKQALGMAFGAMGKATSPGSGIATSDLRERMKAARGKGFVDAAKVSQNGQLGKNAAFLFGAASSGGVRPDVDRKQAFIRAKEEAKARETLAGQQAKARDVDITGRLLADFEITRRQRAAKMAQDATPESAFSTIDSRFMALGGGQKKREVKVEGQDRVINVLERIERTLSDNESGGAVFG